MGKGDRRRRAGRRAVAAARASGSSRRSIVIDLIVVLVLAVAVVGGALWVIDRKTEAAAAPIPPVTSAPDTPAVMLDPGAASVLVGPESAPVTVDVYEDFLCPACRQFEQANTDQFHAKLTAGAIRVRYHPVNLLDSRSDPPGYSLRAANAALAVADVAPTRFLDFHHSLFAAQPEEGARGYEADQLLDLGRRLGITEPRLAEKITSGVFDPAIRRSLEKASIDPALQRPNAGGGKSFGTPTVAVNGSVIDISDANWLDDLVDSTASR